MDPKDLLKCEKCGADLSADPTRGVVVWGRPDESSGLVEWFTLRCKGTLSKERPPKDEGRLIGCDDGGGRWTDLAGCCGERGLTRLLTLVRDNGGERWSEEAWLKCRRLFLAASLLPAVTPAGWESPTDETRGWLQAMSSDEWDRS